MKELSRRLAAIPRDSDGERLEEARALIAKLRGMNMRWNIPGLDKFLTQRMRELFF